MFSQLLTVTQLSDGQLIPINPWPSNPEYAFAIRLGR